VIAGSGEGNYPRYLKQLGQDLGIGSKVTFAGMLQGDLKWGAFRVADAFVLVSHQENFGIAVVEALACGIPVLISDKINIAPTIVAAEAGLVASDSVLGAENLLSTWFSLPKSERERIRANAILCFEKEFSAERAADTLETTLKSFGI
jgi:glycosyltransferase involved in cell wall biosynthesis